ncbi:redoxin domain-containing protein [Romeriopsis navalis]|uniref:redoxin domain-containing protein n=1 Tax=Romeriopsis navalis TaxID=2992132 RepID=UPI003F920758
MESFHPQHPKDDSEGRISFYDWAGDNWVVLFSHPADYTPVCTTELGMVAKLKPQFEQRHCKVMMLSVDRAESHKGWIVNINETQECSVNYPILADEDKKVSELYDMIHPNSSTGSTLTVRIGIHSRQQQETPPQPYLSRQHWTQLR